MSELVPEVGRVGAADVVTDPMTAPPRNPNTRAGASGATTAPVAMASVPDLLHWQPLVRIDTDKVREAMTFAFASGVSGGLFAEALDGAKAGPSSWEAASFGHDLFLDDFVARCFRIRMGGHEILPAKAHLIRLLAAPPADPRSVQLRREICSELASRPEFRRDLEGIYAAICCFRTALEGANIGKKWDSNRRQLDILLQVKDVIDRMARGFGGARSGLARLREFGLRIQAGEPYRSMVDLLQYDENLATLTLKVRVGADGRIRAFDIGSVQENKDNPFVTSPLRRWLARFELLFRGFRFNEGELMARLIDAVFEGLADDVARFVQIFGDLEFYLGALGFRDLAQAAGLSVCLPDLVQPNEPRDLVGLFNPFLVAHGVKAVPCNLHIDRLNTIVLITGPNSGGKTRLLQSIGVAQVLAQAGLFVPARTASMALCPGLVVSLVQETRADQSEGRLGMELIRIRELFERLPLGAMVILDELCSGTNPSEGEEIFELVVRVLSKLQPQAFITTHFLTFAGRLERERRIGELRFLQVELDAEQRATYQFAVGVAHTSLAQHAATRLGVTADQLLSLVEQKLARGQMAPSVPPQQSGLQPNSDGMPATSDHARPELARSESVRRRGRLG